MQKIRPIAIYLPQFHPIPENDEWWGKGFTEWTNVTKARPLFKGHYQPQLPADLGFYDLRLPEIREQQAQMAKEHGIYGFCYYHYWFNGRRVLEMPINEVLESGKPDFPFMLCWANENWTRQWDGRDKEILLEQKYSRLDAQQYINYLIPIFNDKRYIKVNGRPVFAIYRTNLIPNIEEYVQIFKDECKKASINLYLCRFDNFGYYGAKDRGAEFDATIEFTPFSECPYKYINYSINRHLCKIVFKITAKIFSNIGFRTVGKKFYHLAYRRFDYKQMVEFILKSECIKKNYKMYPCATPSWDNTARKKDNPFIYKNSTPVYFKKWLQYINQNFEPFSSEENFIFINAWNEWAEGNHLEPCQKWGKKYLEAIKEVFQ